MHRLAGGLALPLLRRQPVLGGKPHLGRQMLPNTAHLGQPAAGNLAGLCHQLADHHFPLATCGRSRQKGRPA